VAAQTQRAVENFPVSGLTIERELIAPSRRSRAARRVSRPPGLLDPTKAEAIHDARPRWRAATGTSNSHRTSTRTGSGTSSNMNANEVIATLAAERLGAPVHPNDDVNDRSPPTISSRRPSTCRQPGIVRTLIPALDHLAGAFTAKAQSSRPS